MARLPVEEGYFNDQMMAGATPEFSVGEGAEMAADQFLRNSPVSAVARKARDWSDTSERVDPLEANERYGLIGTGAEFKPDEEVTEDRAKAVADDHHRITRNEYIQELVNEDSPVTGRLTQFAAGMAAGFVDPLLMAANVSGAMLIGKGVSSIANSARGMNAIGRVSPMVGRSISRMYDQGLVKSVGDVIVREGLENFAGSMIEETVNFAGVGEERLSRKVSTQESLMNIVTSTVMGGGLGTVMSSDGRKALFRKFGRDLGDGAPNILKSTQILGDLEMKLGLEKGTFEFKLHDREQYDSRPWHKDRYQYTPMTEHAGKKFYLSMEADNVAHSYSYRGNGTVITDNVTQAQNLGSKYIEINADNIRVLRRDGVVNEQGGHTEIGRELATRLRQDILENADMKTVSKALVKYGEGEAEVELTLSQADKMLREGMEGKDIDEMLDILDDLGAKAGSKYNAHKVIDEYLDSTKWNGYQFTGKKSDGNPAYNGLYVLDKFTRKIQKTAEFETAKTGTFQEKIQWDNDTQKAFDGYYKWAKENAGKVGDTTTPVKTSEAPDAPKSEIETTELNTRSEYAKLEAELRSKEQVEVAEGQEPVKLSPEEERQAKFAKERAQGKSLDDMEKAEMSVVERFFGCMRG